MTQKCKHTVTIFDNGKINAEDGVVVFLWLFAHTSHLGIEQVIQLVITVHIIQLVDDTILYNIQGTYMLCNKA